MPIYTEKQRQAVIKRACEAVQARVKGWSLLPSAGQTFDLDVGGWCNRFVRQCFETGVGLAPFSWYFGAAKAAQSLVKLAPYEVPLRTRQPGDILGFPTRRPGDAEHIAIYIGRQYDLEKELVAENTSATRGFPRAPGTKVTSYKTITAGRVVKCYRLFPALK